MSVFDNINEDINKFFKKNNKFYQTMIKKVK